MLIIALDYDQKNVVRGVYRMPEGIPGGEMSYEAAEAAVVAAYSGETDQDPVDILEEQGFESVAFLTTLIS